MVARDARIGKCDIRLLGTPDQDFGLVEGVDLGDRAGRLQQGQGGRGVRSGGADLAGQHRGRRADRAVGFLRPASRRRHRLLAGLDAAHHPEAPLAERLVGLQLDPGRAHHRPVVLAGGVHHQGGQLAGQRPLVVGEALPVARRELDAVEVVDVDAADAYLAAVLDRPDETLAQLDRLHPGAEGPCEHPFDGALEAPLEVPEKPHIRTIAARSGGAGVPGVRGWTSVSPREASCGQLLWGRHWYATPQISDQFRRTTGCNVPRPAAVYPPWPRNPLSRSRSRRPRCTTATKHVACGGHPCRTGETPAATIRCRCSGEWRNWQTRRIQVPVSARTWGFKSPLAHFDGAPPRRGFGLCSRRWSSHDRQPTGATGAARAAPAGRQRRPAAARRRAVARRRPRRLGRPGGRPARRGGRRARHRPGRLHAAARTGRRARPPGRQRRRGPGRQHPSDRGGAHPGGDRQLPAPARRRHHPGARPRRPRWRGDRACQAIEAGTVEGPTVIAAGPAVTMTGGHIAYMGRVADGPEQLRAAVRANLALGAGCIKVVATGGVLTKGVDPRIAAYTQPELDALVAEAHRLGLRVAAHAIGEGGVASALLAGVDSVEHGMFLDQTCIDLFVQTGARYSATFSAPECIIGGQTVPQWIKDRARPAAEAQAASFQAAVKAGVRVVAGTDAGTPENYHGRVSHEVVSMVAAGLDVLAGVRAATAEAADLLGDPDRGVLRPGAAADVLAVHGDVVLDVTALTRPAAVFKSGRQVR